MAPAYPLKINDPQHSQAATPHRRVFSVPCRRTAHACASAARTKVLNENAPSLLFTKDAIRQKYGILTTI